MTCNWNKSWTPTDKLDKCKWIQCINPPQVRTNMITDYFVINTFKSPEGTNLVSDWDEEPVEFFDNSSYSCASQDLYFEMDRDKVAWNMTCLDDGSWDVPATWPVCLSCE
jgi:hypothetical protein